MHRCRSSLRRQATLLLGLTGGIALAGTLPGARAGAQTRFSVSDSTVHVARLGSPYACAAEVQRVLNVLRTREARTADPDTMAGDGREPFRPLPAPVVEAAGRCVEHFGGATAPLDAFGTLFALELAAGRDTVAATLLRRRLAAIDAKHEAVERTAVTDSVVELYMQARPVRLAAAESLLTARLRSKTDRMERLKARFELARVAAVAHDTVQLRPAARAVIALGDSLTPNERDSREFQEWMGPSRMLIAMHWALGDDVFLDSLRSGTAAYAALTRAVWAEANHARPEAAPTPSGKKAPRITADFWFPRDSVPASVSPVRPVPGRINVVAFLHRDRCLEKLAALDNDKHIDACWMLSSSLRRLADRYPLLAFTIVGRTYGYFLDAPPMSPAEEAALVARWAMAHRFPGVLAISSADFSRIESPDGRRVDRPDSNVTRYEFGVRQSTLVTCFLIDQDGLVVDAVPVGDLAVPDALDLLTRKIDVLLNRRGGGGSHAGR
jgi:hypothetical protein